MATSVSFTAEEWMIIRSAPQMVSMAVAGAGGGILGALKEAMAGGQAMVQSAQSRSPIVQKLCSGEEIQAGQQDVQKIIMQDPSNGTPEKLKAMAVQLCAQAAQILAQTAPSEVSDYSALVMTVADTVSKAAKEGGFLGFGGELVSEGERDIMAAVQAALQGQGGGGGFSLPFPSQLPDQPEEPAESPALRLPQTPKQQTGPVGPSRSAGLPGLEPKSTTPPPVAPPAAQPKATQTQPQTPKSTTPKAPTPKATQPGASSKSGLSSKSKSKGGFRTGSGMRKSDQ